MEYEQSALCEHLSTLTTLPEPATHVCAACVEMGDTWVHLRMCMECGNIGCCNSSKNRHATAHHRQIDHPVARGIEPGERWVWCYVDEEAVDL